MQSNWTSNKTTTISEEKEGRSREAGRNVAEAVEHFIPNYNRIDLSSALPG